MNRKSLFLAIGSLFIAFLAFVLLEEKQENLSETVFWKESWEEISFFPPTDAWSGENESYAKVPIYLRSYDLGWKETPIFSVSSKSEDSQEEITYEGNYNVKNSFTDLSVLKTKIWEKASPEVLKSYSIDPSGSPRLEFRSGSSSKELLLGKKLTSDQTRIVAQSSEFVLAPYMYIMDKFKNPIVSFRERQFITQTTGYVKKLSMKSMGISVTAENAAEKNQYGSFVSNWRRPTGERIVLPPEIGSSWEAQAKALRADLYPDDENGPGFAFSKEKTQGEGEILVECELSSGLLIRLKIFPPVTWQDQEYRPVIRELKGFFTESPSFVKSSTFESFVLSASQVKNAKRWERPNQRIQ